MALLRMSLVLLQTPSLDERLRRSMRVMLFLMMLGESSKRELDLDFHVKSGGISRTGMGNHFCRACQARRSL